jgi:hypothetical protein
MLTRSLIALVLLCGVAFGQSSPSPTPPAEQHQNSAKQHAAAKAENNQPAKTLRQRFSNIWEKTWEEPVAFYTLVLTAFTGLLAIVSFAQGIFLVRADKTARISANAANLSAKAAIGQKLPIVRCHTPHLWPSPNALHNGSFMGTGDPRDDGFIKVIELNFQNHGETLAYPTEYGLGWLITTKEPTEIERLPPEPDYPDVYSVSPETVFKDIFDTNRILTFCLALTDNRKAEFKSGKATLRLCAYLKYRDFLETLHEVRFCWRWEPSRGESRGMGLVQDFDVPEPYTRKT